VKWLKLTIKIPDDYQENFIAELLDLDFEGFEQFDDKLEAFISIERFNDVNREYIEQILTDYPFDGYIETEEIEQQNWNRAWEETIIPQVIGKFFVKPTWSAEKPPAGRILLEIDPKMAFGTGYHATTQLILEELPNLKPKGKSVLDAGTGTGILAIASVRLGARDVLAFDIDEWSKVNAVENSQINGVDKLITFLLGGFEVIPAESTYDLILANINRNVITGMMGEFASHLETGGDLCVTGFQEPDKEIVIHTAQKFNLNVSLQRDLEEWSMLNFKKPFNT
jgi:ribosomal protein L11 methyltransferase